MNLNKVILLFVLIFFYYSTDGISQILLTAIDDANSDVRACLLNEKSGEVEELASNNTYLPIWCGNDIVYNFGNHLWKVDTIKRNDLILYEGIKPVFAPKNKMIASYNKNGIMIGNLKGEKIKLAEVEYWDKISITFSADEKKISYYNKIKDVCYLFDWESETVTKFGSNILHPVWSPDGKKILLNKGTSEENYRVGIVDESWIEGNDIHFISDFNENAIVPIWSPKQNFIAYMNLDHESKNQKTDLFSGEIVLFSLFDGTKKVVATDAGHTESAYPEFCFDTNENYLYYTSINENGKGSISRIDLKNNYTKKKLTNNDNIDYRLPNCKK